MLNKDHAIYKQCHVKVLLPDNTLQYLANHIPKVKNQNVMHLSRDPW